MKPTVSLAIIVNNEERDLPSCLESVQGLVSEIALIDSMSTDRTVEIAKSFGARVESRAFDSFANQKNAAIDLATNDWILNLDADERLSPLLKAEIEAVFASGHKADAYSIPYVNFFLGREMKYSGLSGERHIRLFNRKKARFGGGLVHEGISVCGITGRLENPIIHNSYPDMEEYLEKFNRYTTLSAQKMHAEGKRFCFLKILSAPFEFHKRFFLKLGFLDGVAGLAWSGLAAFYVFVKYIKLWRIEKGE